MDPCATERLVFVSISRHVSVSACAVVPAVGSAVYFVTSNDASPRWRMAGTLVAAFAM